MRTIDAAELGRLLDSGVPLTVLDLRRRADYDANSGVIPGARWLDHEKIAEWGAALPRDRAIVLYCAHGRSISNAALDYLLARGFSARLVAGGMDGWQAAGGSLAPKP